MTPQRIMTQPDFRSLSETMMEVGLDDLEVAYLLRMSKARYFEISTPASHNLTLRESTAITELSKWLGSLMTIFEPSFIRTWLFTPAPEPEGRAPAQLIANGDAGSIDDFIELVNDKRAAYGALDCLLI